MNPLLSPRFAALISLFILIAPTVFAQSRSATAVLRSVDSALRSLTTATYDVTAINWNVDGSSRTRTGRIFLSRHAIDDGVGFRIRFEAPEGVLAYDGSRILWLDRADSTVLQFDSTMTMARYLNGNVVGQYVKRIISATRPFIALDSNATLEETVEMAGVRCASVRVHNEESDDFKQPKNRWCFGLDDHFPRRYELSGLFHGQLYADTITYANVRLDDPLDDSLFTIVTPHGYTFELQKPWVEPTILADGSPLPEFDLASTSGARVTPASLRGRVIVLDFWYIACAPCLQAMPHLSALQKRYGADSVLVLGVNVHDSLDRVKKLLASREVAYESLLFGDDLATALGISGYPTLFVIGRDGRIVRSMVGSSEHLEMALAAMVEEALARR